MVIMVIIVVMVVIVLVIVVVEALLGMKIVVMIHDIHFASASEGNPISILWEIELRLGIVVSSCSVQDRLIWVRI